ncbi:MAG TPA: universal stress protein [Bryobacteraceae bacterium]|nr:universal stress protein [Bryobacteraceae bacterium]
MRIRNLLFPIDFSERSRATAPFVYALAKLYDSRVILVHAYQAAPPFPEVAGVTVDDCGALEPITQRRLRQFAEEQLPNVNTLLIAAAGSPSDVIRTEATARRVDLVAMPTHGYGGFRRLLIGSVTARMLRKLDVPIWTDAHVPEPSHRAHPQPRRILAAIDLKPQSQRAAEFALQLGRDTQAEVEVVHAVAEGVTVPEAAGPHLEEIVEVAASTQAVEIDRRFSTVDLRMGDPNPAIRLRDLALRRRADLMVIGRGAIQNRLDGFSAHAYDIIRESPCPVISV